MKVLYYDVFCGMSGDMNLGALVDLGVDLEYLKAELKKLKIDEEFDVVAHRGMKHGISGTKVDVILYNQGDKEQDHHHHPHGHSHDGHPHETHVPHSHEHELNHAHPHQKTDHDHHRNFATIKAMIEASDLNDYVKQLSVAIFKLIAIAEGKVHNKPIEEVHFHEVGATDSIVDIVGAAICLDYLKVDRVMASSIQVGGGFVKCAHGRMPVPAPATAEILTDVPLNYNIVPYETTTPTGAAILKATVEVYNDQHSMSVERTGYGLGNKDFDVPNILRVYLGDLQSKETDLIVEEEYLMDCNIDDMSGENFPFVEALLFEAGALDVYKTPIMMKKGRLATKLSVLFKTEDRKKLQKILLTHTTTAGLRETKVMKYRMHRSFETLKTQYGDVTIKHLYYDGELIKSKPEYDDCARLAKQHQITLSDVYRAIQSGTSIADK